MTSETSETREKSEKSEPATDGRSRSRRRRWIAGLLVTLGLLVGLRLAAPYIVDAWLSARLGRALAVPVAIDHVELSLWSGAITARGVQAAPAPDTSASTVRVDALAARWAWSDLLYGDLAVDVDVDGLDATLDLRRPWPATRDAGAQGDLTWLRTLTIRDGAVAVVLAADAPPILRLTDLQGSAVATATEIRTETMTNTFELAARVGETGSLKLDGSIAPVAPASTWTVQFALDRLDLRAQNPLFQSVFEMDVERGWLSVDGSLTVGLGQLRGQLRPRFDDLQLLGRGEPRARHPMAEALFGSMLSGADLPIVIDRPADAAGPPLLAQLGDVDAHALLTSIILRGFIRRLDTIDGYDADAARLELDFPAGRLSFFDVTMTRTGGQVGPPFVRVERMDLVVEQTAVDSDVRTYKAIALHRPTLTFVTGVDDAHSQLTIDPDWQEKLSVLPYPTDRLEVFDGRLEYRDETSAAPTNFFMSSLELRADNLGRARVEAARRGATLTGRARVMDLSPLSLDAAFSPGVVPLDLALTLRLAPLRLDQLNALLRGRLGVDVSAGTLGLVADLDVHDDHVQGTITPALQGVRVLGSHELEIDHPLRELLLERRLRRLDGVDLELDYHVRENLVRELPGALLSAALHAR